ncbi:MAG: pyridoxal phosphate-dependent decarboxylase family protein, partial [Bryobacteraceae bacterium]
FGYSRESIDGTFATGGAEANHTAVLAALSVAFPRFAATGVRGLPAQPVFYASVESHHSLSRAGRLCGLGMEAFRPIAVDSSLRMIPAALAAQIRRDRETGFLPFLIAATGGTTNAGAIDPLPELAAISESERLWFHVDAAWGGAIALVPEMHQLLSGIECADSITFDAHKWLSVPMGAGIFFTRHRDALDRTFRMQTAYMPREAQALDVTDPHLHSIQWSRRFIGLKLFLTLLAAGWEGYASAIRHQTAMGALLKRELISSGWVMENDSPLPVVCFSDPAGGDPHRIAMLVVSAGDAWISTTIIGGEKPKSVLRACITNFRTQPPDIHALVASLERARGKAHAVAAGNT